ncbi:MAG: winged helix-turn-helix transcriptional regulator [Prevotella sp.]
MKSEEKTDVTNKEDSGLKSNLTTETTTETTTEIIRLLIKDNPKITGKELAAKCHITEDGVAYQIKKLKKLNIIKRKGGTRNGGYWEILQ